MFIRRDFSPDSIFASGGKRSWRMNVGVPFVMSEVIRLTMQCYRYGYTYFLCIYNDLWIWNISGSQSWLFCICKGPIQQVAPPQPLQWCRSLVEFLLLPVQEGSNFNTPASIAFLIVSSLLNVLLVLPPARLSPHYNRSSLCGVHGRTMLHWEQVLCGLCLSFCFMIRPNDKYLENRTT